MTRRAILTADQLDITLAQHKQLLDAIEMWTGTSAHVCDRCTRNFVTGETSIRVQIQGIPKSEIITKLEQLDAAVADLPGDWPVPSEAADLKAE